MAVWILVGLLLAVMITFAVVRKPAGKRGRHSRDIAVDIRERRRDARAMRGRRQYSNDSSWTSEDRKSRRGS